ncbi:hypothetical protein [Marilutibacter chinensis]|uniref:YfdX protein n=1 Tax=Marilutibacter chinensis TaxID=2912247 RepID=A0ABS9HPG5_9GAMM|nr:hypothetical protein [Lysobacter chinensis]MCF7220245.1 hypothetical protein [Lysobacter chinensis]
MSTLRILPAMLCLLLPLAAQAADPAPSGIGAEIRQELADARQEVDVELARARQELETGNLRLDDGMHFGRSDRPHADLPRAEITPQGDFLIEGRAQTIDADQRRELLAYRGLVVGIARSGIDIGQRGAEAALDAVGTSWVGMLFGAMTGSLERRVERTIAEEIEPAVRNLCRQLPAAMESQQRLARSLPQFRPYATLEADDVDDCEEQVRQGFASR